MSDQVRTFPHVRVQGGHRERGRQYGEQARDRVRRSIEAYDEVFANYAGWRWDDVRNEAQRYVEPIERFDARYLEEMRGIAEGAGVTFEDVLGINVRTEVMFAAKARRAGRREASRRVQRFRGSARGERDGSHAGWPGIGTGSFTPSTPSSSSSRRRKMGRIS